MSTDNYQVSTNEIMDFLKENMVMRGEFEDLRNELRKTELNLIDAMDRKNAELKGDLVILMRKEDSKVVNLIETLKQNTTLTPEEAKKLLIMEPFPKLFV